MNVQAIQALNTVLTCIILLFLFGSIAAITVTVIVDGIQKNQQDAEARRERLARYVKR